MKFPEYICYIMNEVFIKMEKLLPPIYGDTLLSKNHKYDSFPQIGLKKAQRNHDFFGPHISLKRNAVLDIGCGSGSGSIFYATKTNRVIGVDMNQKLIKDASRSAKLAGLADKAQFIVCDASSLPFSRNTFDLIISNNVMEHLSRPLDVLQECKRVAKNSGFICINFGPPWLSAFGGHIGKELPWTHVLFSERVVKKMLIKQGRCSLQSQDKPLYSNVNRMTVRKFKDILQKTDLRVRLFKLWSRRYVTPLLILPFVKEFFTAQVIAVLQKDTG